MVVNVNVNDQNDVFHTDMLQRRTHAQYGPFITKRCSSFERDEKVVVTVAQKANLFNGLEPRR